MVFLWLNSPCVCALEIVSYTIECIGYVHRNDTVCNINIILLGHLHLQGAGPCAAPECKAPLLEAQKCRCKDCPNEGTPSGRVHHLCNIESDLWKSVESSPTFTPFIPHKVTHYCWTCFLVSLQVRCTPFSNSMLH